jgi:transcriptional regulator with XRE-family HTH domain
MITPAQCRAARALLNWSQQQLADASKAGVVTIRNFEGGKSSPINSTLEVLRRALESAGVEFTDGNAPGVKLHKPGARVASIPIEDLNAENDE